MKYVHSMVLYSCRISDTGNTNKIPFRFRWTVQNSEVSFGLVYKFAFCSEMVKRVKHKVSFTCRFGRYLKLSLWINGGYKLLKDFTFFFITALHVKRPHLFANIKVRKWKQTLGRKRYSGARLSIRPRGRTWIFSQSRSNSHGTSQQPPCENSQKLNSLT